MVQNGAIGRRYWQENTGNMTEIGDVAHICPKRRNVTLVDTPFRSIHAADYCGENIL